MSDIEDIDRRFNELRAQIDQEEQRKMGKAAAKEWARLPGVRRRRRRRLAVVAVVAVVAGAGLLVTYRPELVSRIPGVVSERFPDMNTALRLGPVPEETTPVDVRPPKLSPFEGSPAMDYADGAKGLVMPAAKATGGLSHKDVATALKRTRDMLKASHLDRKTLMGGRPTALTKLLHPKQREWFLKNLDRRKPKTKKDIWDSRYWVTSLAPKTAELATDVIKVKGRTKYSAFREGGRSGVRIRVNYLFVYAIHRPGRPEPTERIIAHNLGEILAYRENGELVIWPVDWNTDGVANARCDVDDAFVHPFYDDSVPDEEAPETPGPLLDPYDLDREAKEEEGCRLVSRT